MDWLQKRPSPLAHGDNSPMRPPHRLSRSALPVIALAALITPEIAGAQRLLDWHGPALAAPPAASRDATRDWIRLERSAGGWTVRVANPFPGPVQVRLNMRDDAYYRAVPALPAAFTLAANQSRVLARLYELDSGQAPALDLRLDMVPGLPGAHPEDAVYRLPFAGAPIRIDQGFGGAASHHDAANRYALDFALPVGTPVLAARAGRIVQVEAGFHEGGADPALAARANQIRVLHRDGSMAVYAHLAADSLAVRAGQWVEAGQRLADSGDTGFSTAPHLHFAVQVNAGLRLASIPFRMAGPLGELRFPTVLADDTATPPATAPGLPDRLLIAR